MAQRNGEWGLQVFAFETSGGHRHRLVRRQKHKSHHRWWL